MTLSETQHDIIRLIKTHKTIIIHRHQRPDPDAIGSQMGLAAILRASFPGKTVYSVGKQYPGFDWLGKTDSIEDDVYKDALVIVVDTANQPRVDDARYTMGNALVKIDHHPNDDPFGVPMWVAPDASSTSELIYDFYAANQDNLTMTDDAARLLYAGIVGDTGRFMYPSTSPHTMAVAGALMAFNFSASAVNQQEDEISLPLARLSAYVYENLTVLESGAAYLKLTDELLEPFGLKDESTSSIVPLPGRLGEVVAWAIFVESKDHTFRIRLRSKGPEINELAKRHGGGGHPLASGAVAHDDTEIKQVIEELDNLVQRSKGE
ncbi:bifunctional oligoribonuclease/PAP phosphatase NrnA [Secundilactobacillus kimchicus]|uniref:Phosphoesterase n=1 Tax=Secundilactobacillus kimchicus JCM 15530 TaxID=1302272 RepID=A0A0R1HV38_9LACO|nr:bifunctional oligoribonuclease/PAP phosphatase NrnA [Secundilactobacillus kimchicus]KRK47178.1 phosphoesterase [Secundilactobacillus kimchicus JCM 15530]MBT9671701.1 bifunctional oligoribonuclease/PAP phosphatase NrnA [Secundilactobacillus kimchicus]